ncbi:hypothetical protein F5888DRAFT_1697104, partial [Russula emetica]
MLRTRRGLRACALLSHLVPAEFHQAQKGTRHRACIILYANTILYLRTLAIEGSEGLLYLEMKEEDRSLTDDSDDPEA